MIKIVIADDHHLVRQGIRALIEKHADLQVMGEAQDGVEALELVEKLRPDVLILDINMPRLGGIDVANRIRELNVACQVLVLSMYSDESIVKRAFRNGVRGYLLKKSIAEDLVLAINTVARRQRYVSRELSVVLGTSPLRLRNVLDDKDAFDRLTPREREVCQLIADGLTNNAIAHRLNISVKTVEKHRANLMEKLGIQDVASLIREAIKHGIVFLER
jgi:DNA-binding NarL/FixJ family response regulator